MGRGENKTIMFHCESIKVRTYKFKRIWHHWRNIIISQQLTPKRRICGLLDKEFKIAVFKRLNKVGGGDRNTIRQNWKVIDEQNKKLNRHKS